MDQIRRRQIMGTVFGVLSQAFGVAYLLYTIVAGGFSADSAGQIVATLIQISLIIGMIFGFFDNKKNLLFGAALLSMCYNGINYLVDDFVTVHPIDTFPQSNPWPYVAGSFVYFVIDAAWVAATILCFLAAFGLTKKPLLKPAWIIFLLGGIGLLLNSIFYMIDVGMGSATSASSSEMIIGSLGDGFALLAYATALHFVSEDGTFHLVASAQEDTSNPLL